MPRSGKQTNAVQRPPLTETRLVPLWLRSLDFFFLTRPILFFPGWATLLAGYLVATGKNGWQNWHPLWWSSRMLLAIVAFAMAMGSSFIFNQLRDVDSDRENNKLFLLGEGYVPVHWGYVEAFLLLGIAIVLGLLVSKLFLGTLLIFILLTGYLYNYPPFVFKNRPVAGLIANMLMGWLAFILGVVTVSPERWSMPLAMSSPYVALNTALYLLTTIPDVKGDARTRKITFPVRYGLRWTVGVSLGLYLLAGILGFVFHDAIVLLTLIGSSFFFVRLVYRPTVANAVRALKAGILAFLIVIALHFPQFLGVALALFFLTRYYYWKRFRFTYPRFGYSEDSD